MGVILDSSTIISRERKGQSVAELLTSLRDALGPEPIALTTVSVIELEHGIWRAGNQAQATRRRQFFADLFEAVPVHPLTLEIARRAARIDGQSRQKDVTIPFQDLVIGATALEFDYSVATANLRHFQLIPGLAVRNI